jgi:hypothetical protein
MFAAALINLQGPQLNGDRSGLFMVITFIPSFALLLFAVIGWVIAPLLSRFITSKYDAPIAVSGLSLQDLYSFSFVFLGLYFVLGSLGDVLNWLHYSFMVAVAHDFDPERKKSLYGLSKPLITMIAGFICLASGKRWAKKLSDKAD